MVNFGGVEGSGLSWLRLEGSTHRLHSSSFLGLPYRILNIDPYKGLWVGLRAPLS